MASDTTKQYAPPRGSPAVRPPVRAGFPRLAITEPAPLPTRASWAGTVGNTLLEMPWLIWSVLDLLIIGTGVYLGYEWFVWLPGGEWIQIGWFETSLIQCPLLIVAGLVFGLYEQQTLLRRSRIVVRSLLTGVGAVALAYIVIWLGMHSVHSRGALLLAGALYLAVAPAVRLLACACIPSYRRRFLIVGTDRKSRLRPAGMGDGLSRRYELLGYISLEEIEVGRIMDGRRVLGTVEDIERICVDHEVAEVVVGPAAAKNLRVLEKTLSCLRLGCRVTNLSTFYEQVLSEVPVDHLEPHWFLFADLKHYREAQLIMKRVFDVVMSIVGLLVTLPLWPLIALLIVLDSPGPIFYRQRRVGLNGRSFHLHKFRTMYVSAEVNGHAWAAENDPRVTRIGWYLRRSRLDELPQLWNILIGEMSVVGPRPERPEFVTELCPQIQFYNERHLIKPGLTGWAQINYRYGASVEDARRKLQLDLWYIKHMSMELDLVILLRTMGTLFLGSR